MKIKNTRRATVVAQVYVNGRPGKPKMVMLDDPEELWGPIFMKDGLGRDVYMTVPGEVTVIEYGESSTAQNIIAVEMAPVSKEWTDGNGVKYTLVVEDFRYQ